MTGFNHVLTGISIALTVQHPVLAPILALASHFLLDMIPHFGGLAWFETWSRPLRIMVAVDSLLSVTFLATSLMLFPEHSVLIVWCVIGATLPDWLWILYYKFNIRHRFFAFHLAIQRYERPWGIYVELSFGALLIGLLLHTKG